MIFKNRLTAAKKLAKALLKYKGQNAVIYALPRGGVILGVELAKQLQAPLDLIIPRKIGHPYSSEYALCALAEHGSLVCNEAEKAGVDKHWFALELKKEQEEVKRRRKVYLSAKPRLKATNKIAIIVDDGVATGLTMKAAILDVRKQEPKKIVVAVPVISKQTTSDLEVDEVVALEKPILFRGSIGAYYQEFEQVNDNEVVKLLANL